MKNKNRIYRAAALLLVLCFISTVMISGTFAKYTSEYSGSDTALVARWSFTGFVGQKPVGETQDLHLFKHEFNKHINQRNGENGDYIIAPGVSGEFVVAMDYLADVDADVTISINPLSDNANVPIEYLVKGKDENPDTGWITLDDLAGTLASRIEADTTTTVSKVSGNTFRMVAVDEDVSISETVQWRWAYDSAAQTDNLAIDSSDATDTKLGEDSAAGDSRTSYGIKITLTATQVLPTTGDETAIATSITGIGNISGTAKVGEILAVESLEPEEATVTYQWQFSDTENGSYGNIAEATENSYMVAGDYAGKYIRVKATGTGSSTAATNYYTGTVYSAPVGPIAESD